jgi:hypothetical protein
MTVVSTDEISKQNLRWIGYYEIDKGHWLWRCKSTRFQFE